MRTLKDKNLLARRDKKAKELGEGAYVHHETKRHAAVRVSFYPNVSLHVKDWNGEAWGEWRRITREQLEAEYDKIRL